MSAIISPETFAFLKDLKENNNREWFQENKSRYEKAHANVVEFAEALAEKMSEHDHLVPRTGKKTLFRIYRDVRFSKNKSPYKTNFGGQLTRATEALRGGYYFQIEPGNTFMAGGFWAPNADDLKRIRNEFAFDDQPVRKIIASKEFQHYFGELKGEGVKTAPKGFAKDHPAIDLIRKKQFIVDHYFSDKEVLSEDFVDKINETFKALRPYFDYMSEVLTTDENGVSLI